MERMKKSAQHRLGTCQNTDQVLDLHAASQAGMVGFVAAF
jgi:hypothetical protein